MLQTILVLTFLTFATSTPLNRTKIQRSFDILQTLFPKHPVEKHSPDDYTVQLHDHSHKQKHKHKHVHQHSGTAEHTATHSHVADHSHEHEHVHRHKHNHIHDETAEHDHQHREGHTHRHKDGGYGSRRRSYEKLAVDRTKELLKTYMASQYSRMTGFGK